MHYPARVVLAAFAVLMSVATFADAANLVPNPGFEEIGDDRQPDAWRFANWGAAQGGEAEFELSTIACAGRYAAKVSTLIEGVRHNVVLTQNLPEPMQPNADYLLRAWFKTSGDARAHLYMSAYDAAGEKLMGHSSSALQAPDWKPLTIEFTTPAQTMDRATVTLYTTHGRGAVWFDEVWLAPADEAPPAPGAADARRVVVSEDFSGSRLPEAWEVVAGQARVTNGALEVEGPATIVVREELGQNMRVEYTAWTEGPACDLSVLLNVADEGAPLSTGYLFGFGSRMNTLNLIARQGKDLITTDAESFSSGIVTGKKHHVVAERRDKRLMLSIDGEIVFETSDMMAGEIEGEQFGFYIWSNGWIDDVTGYALPQATQGEARAEVPLETREHVGFGDDTEGGAPEGFEVKAEGGSAEVVDMPTWVYQETAEAWVRDLCLRQKGAADGVPCTVSRDFPALASGIVEWDVLPKALGEYGVQFALHDTAGKPVAVLRADAEGVLRIRTPEGEDRPISVQRYSPPHRFDSMDLRLDPGRWHTLRLSFDADADRFHVSLLNLYATAARDTYRTAEVEESDYLPLDTDVAFAAPADRLASFSVTASSGSEVLWDNLCVLGPVGTRTVEGKNIRLNARALLDLDSPLRKDPFDLKTYSERNLSGNRGRGTLQCGESYRAVWKPGIRSDIQGTHYEAFGEQGAIRYNALLVRHAFVEERLQMLDRTVFYLQNAGEFTADLSTRLEAAREAVQAAGDALEDAYLAYTGAYMDHLNEPRLQREFGPAAALLEDQLARAGERLEACLDALPASALAGGDRSPCPLPRPRDYPQWQDGQWMRDGRPDFIFPAFGPMYFPETERILGLQPLRRMDRVIRRLEPGQLVDTLALTETYEEAVRGRPDARVFCWLSLGSNDLRTTMSRPWILEHEGDPDIFIWTPEGEPVPDAWSPHNSKASCAAHLNYWHPGVREALRTVIDGTTEYISQEVGDRLVFYYMGGEIGNQAKAYEAGHNRTAIAAFQEFLRDEYGSLEGLNRTWGSSYRSFDEITPPKVAGLPSGVQYDFHRFRDLAHRDWRRECLDIVREHTPRAPVVGDIHTTLGHVDHKGFDIPTLVGSFDVLSWHTYRPHEFLHSNRWMGNLRDVFGMPLGNMEWAANMSLGELFAEPGYKRNGLARRFHMMMWGQAACSLWYGQATGWSPGANWTDPRMGHAVLRYSSTYIPLAIDRARRIGRTALETRAVSPDVGILEVTSSYYNAMHQATVRKGMSETAQLLEERGYDHGFFYEDLLIEGRQHLDGVQTLIAPNPACMKPELSELLRSWCEAGGMLICYGVPGAYDQHGKPLGDLPRAAFPGVTWERTGINWAPTGDGAPAAAEDYGEGRALYAASIGRGSLLIYSSFAQLDLVVPKAVDRVAGAINRSFYCRDNAFELSMRQSEEGLYLYVLNFSLDEVREDEIVVARGLSGLVDLGLQQPVRVPVTAGDDATRFRVKLQPAEGTLLRLLD